MSDYDKQEARIFMYADRGWITPKEAMKQIKELDRKRKKKS